MGILRASPDRKTCEASKKVLEEMVEKVKGTRPTRCGKKARLLKYFVIKSGVKVLELGESKKRYCRKI